MTKTVLAVVTALVLTGSIARSTLAQERDAPDNRQSSDNEEMRSPTRALDEAQSRAEKEAERLVSLSPESIILLLQREPGLFLEVKKLLVRKAFSRGQVVDANQLTDEAVFRQVREDEETRAFITQEIVDRGYVRAKPGRRELAQQYAAQQKLAEERSRQAEASPSEYGFEERGNGARAGYGSRGQQGPIENVPSWPPNAAPEQQTPTAPQPPANFNNDQQRSLLAAGMNGAQAQEAEPQGLPLNVINGDSAGLDTSTEALLNAYRGQQGTGSGAAGSPQLARLSSPSGRNRPPQSQLPSSQEEAFNQTHPRMPEVADLESLPSQRRSIEPRANDTDRRPSILHRANPYADVPSLYDLYAQYSRRPAKLERFGVAIFENGTGNLDRLPMDLPAGPEYVLGPGDALNIDLWGSVSTRMKRVVDSEGRLSLPEIGTIQVAGHNLGDVQRIVQSSLRSQYRQLDADVSLDRLRSIRIYVVGDVLRPGAYDVSSLSSPLNALYEAGGPTAKGSLRRVKHYRGNQLIEEVDLYDLLLNGVRSKVQRLESGDTVLVPPIGGEVTIEGMVRRPAIYELGREKSLAEVLELAGGVLPSGTLRHVDVDRVQAHESRSMLRLDIPENNDDGHVAQVLEAFQIQDGDHIKISPILPFSEKTVYLDGHVFRPGKYAYREGMKLSDLVHGYSDLLPEPYRQHAEIIRLQAPDYQPQIIAFNLDDALSGKNQNLVIKPFDTVRIFSRFDFEDPPIITVSGEVRDPGDHLTNGTTRLRDAIFLAGNTTPDAELDDVQVFRKTRDGKMEILSANLEKALRGDANENIMLVPQDRVLVHKDVSRVDPPTVEVDGEVARPGKYPLARNMTATALVRVAGGLKRSAYADQAELTRYTIEKGEKIEGEHITIAMGRALGGDSDSDIRLHPGDVLTIRQVAGWKDVGATATIDGEVVHPGTYGIEQGERLSDLLRRAGGFRPDAYPYGVIFERQQVKEIEEKRRLQLIADTKAQGADFGTIGEGIAGKQASALQWQETLQTLETTPAVGRVIIHIGRDSSWVHTTADIQLRAGDSVYIPKRPNFVLVEGAVYNTTGITFRPGKSAGWYLRQAGGPTSAGDRKNIFIVRADGSVVGGKKGMFNGGALEAPMQPGDMIVVPNKALGGGFKWRDTLQVAQLVSAVGIAVQVARGF